MSTPDAQAEAAAKAWAMPCHEAQRLYHEKIVAEEQMAAHKLYLAQTARKINADTQRQIDAIARMRPHDAHASQWVAVYAIGALIFGVGIIVGWFLKLALAP